MGWRVGGKKWFQVCSNSKVVVVSDNFLSVNLVSISKKATNKKRDTQENEMWGRRKKCKKSEWIGGFGDGFSTTRKLKDLLFLGHTPKIRSRISKKKSTCVGISMFFVVVWTSAGHLFFGFWKWVKTRQNYSQCVLCLVSGWVWWWEGCWWWWSVVEEAMMCFCSWKKNNWKFFLSVIFWKSSI